MTQKELKKYVAYDPETGKFNRLLYKKGKDFTHVNDQGYIIAFLAGKKYRAHHLAWLYAYGTLPNGQLDHINGVKTDNRIANLREVTNQENSKNAKLYSTNKVGFRGVGIHQNKYRAFITVNYKSIHLGVFDTIEEAKNARLAAEQKYNFHKNHGRKQ